MRNLLPIGRFSEICRLSVPSLRHYDELGLLPPAAVDQDTGYRYYSPAQADDAERIRLLRFLEMPLPEIRAALAADRDGRRVLLEDHRRRLLEQVDRQRYAIGLLDRMLQEEPAMEYEVHLREVKPQPAAAIRGRTSWAEIGPFVGGALKETYEAAADQGVRLAGPAFAMYHSADSGETEVDLEVGFPVAEAIEAGGRVKRTTIPGGLVATTVHEGRYEDIGQAYRALGEWVQEHGHETAGPPREVYVVGPEQSPDPGGLRTEVVWPVR